MHLNGETFYNVILSTRAAGLKFNDSEKKWTPGAHLLLKCYLKGKISRKLTNGQNIDYSEKRKWPKGFMRGSRGGDRGSGPPLEFENFT